MLKKTLLAAALTFACSAVQAAAYFIVVPNPGKTVPADINVALTSYTMPVGMVGVPYAGVAMKSLLSVTGDPGYTGYGVHWTVAAGSLPPGLTLTKNGSISGTPTAKGPSAFEIRATYKTKTGQQAYTIVVNGAVLEVTQISAGGYHTCAITTANEVMCWGANYFGQLGDGTTIDRLTPVAVVDLPATVTQLQARNNATCAMNLAGGLKCWGANYGGQLGDGTTTARRTPGDVSGLTSGVAKFALGGIHACALTMTGGVKCWGVNESGQLGDGSTTMRLTPVDVVGLSAGVEQLAVGGEFSCAVLTVGGVKCWGANASGQLGDGSKTNRVTPENVYGLSGAAQQPTSVAQLTTGNAHACVLEFNGGVQCWGFNYGGQLGDGTKTDRTTAQVVLGLTSGVKQISTGGHHTCAVTASGGAKCWGNNNSGPLGDGTTTDRTTPVDVLGLTSGVAQISAGAEHTCAVITGDTAKCWGRNNGGQLGDGSTTNSTTPVLVAP